MLYYTALYCTVLNWTILYYPILYYTVLYYTILYYTILYYTILYYTILYYTTMLDCIVWYFTEECCIVLCRVVFSMLHLPYVLFDTYPLSSHLSSSVGEWTQSSCRVIITLTVCAFMTASVRLWLEITCNVTLMTMCGVV